MDEILMPTVDTTTLKKLPTLPSLIQDHEARAMTHPKSRGNKGASWVFKNMFFYLIWPNDTSVLDTVDSGNMSSKNHFTPGGVMPYLFTQAKTKRLTVSQVYKVRLYTFSSNITCVSPSGTNKISQDQVYCDAARYQHGWGPFADRTHERSASEPKQYTNNYKISFKILAGFVRRNLLPEEGLNFHYRECDWKIPGKCFQLPTVVRSSK